MGGNQTKITVKRTYKKADYTIGHLYVDGVYICNTLEDKDRGLTQKSSLEAIKRVKIPGETAIPSGVYKVDLNTFSPRFGSRNFYQNTCEGKLPRLVQVPGFDGVLIHCGNTKEDSSGCILVGYNKVKGGLVSSQEAFKIFYNKIKDAEDLIIEII